MLLVRGVAGANASSNLGVAPIIIMTIIIIIIIDR
jgi:hypothetical protein